MSWGSELWDQYENLSYHTQKGLAFLEKYGQFIKDRSIIENEYATKLRKLAKHYMPKKKEDEIVFSSQHAFVCLLNELNCLAGQHELIGENLVQHICNSVTNLVKEIKAERKKHFFEGSRLQTELHNCINLLDKTKKSYEKSFKESEKAQESYLKADADINLSRAEVEKSKSIATTKNQLCEQAKSEYANQLQKTNDVQRRHFHENIPSIFQQLQDMDERRTVSVQNFFKQAAHVEKQVLPIISKCLDDMIEASDTIDPKKDSQLVIDRYKSGFEPQDDFPFEDLSCYSNNNTSKKADNSFSGTNTLKGTITRRGGGKRSLFGLFASNKNNVDEPKEDYSDLPPQQRKKRLLQKIEQINIQIQQETRSREGMMNLKVAYEKNSSLGDPQTLNNQLLENGIKVDKLKTELAKYQGYLQEVEGVPVTPASDRKLDQNSISEESLSRSASDSSVSQPISEKASSVPDMINNHTYETAVYAPPSDSPESGISINQQDEDEFDNGPELDMEPLAVLGTARALYPFNSTSEGSISIYEGEEFEIVELDQGDGWTRIRKSNLDEGFVPSTYIEYYLLNNC